MNKELREKAAWVADMCQHVADGGELEVQYGPNLWKAANSLPRGASALHGWRKKSRTILINGHEVPEPVREPLEEGQEFYIAVPSLGSLHMGFVWGNNLWYETILERGLIHLTPEAAIAHSKALLSFTEVGDGEKE